MRAWFMMARGFFSLSPHPEHSALSGHLRVWCTTVTLQMFTGEIKHWEMKIIYQSDSEFGDQIREITQTGTMRPWNGRITKSSCLNSLNPFTTLLSTSLPPAKNYYINLVYHTTRNSVICIGQPVLKIWWNTGALWLVRYGTPDRENMVCRESFGG